MGEQIWKKEEEIIKKKFREKYEELLNGNEDVDNFIRYMLKPLRSSIRINTLKVDCKEITERLEEKGYILKKIPWFEYGFFIDHEDKEKLVGLGNLKEHLLGYIYIQEASSMIPPVVLDLEEDMFVLDMCAAPGSKTTQISQIMNNSGIVVANDVDMERVAILSVNVQRMGCINVIITKFDGRKLLYRFPNLKFDRILVDVPCSSEGAIRKTYSVLNTWSEKNIIRLSNLQKKLIEVAFNMLKEGGVLVYSTCTLDPRENEGVISYLINKYENARVVKPNINGLKYREGVLEWKDLTFNEEVKKTIRVWPQDNDTQGFFIAKIIKE